MIGFALGAVSFPVFSLELFVQAFGLLIFPQLLQNIFEEFGFRGYLAPKLNTLGLNVFVAHMVVGLIWGIWHLPYFSFVTSYTTQSPVTLIPLFLTGTIAASIVYGEIRILTNSVWPAVLMQTVGGAFITGLLLQDFIEIANGMEILFSPVIEGVLTIVLFTLIGIGIHLLRRKRMTATQKVF